MKHREYKLYEDGTYNEVLDEIDLLYSSDDPIIHVVEMSALHASKAREAKLVEVLEFYAKAPCDERIMEIAPRFREPAREALANYKETGE